LVAEASLLGSLLGFFVYNRYPARTFGGNVGSNFVSAAMVSFAVLGGFEIFLLVALLPAILNEAVVIASMGGLKSGKEVVKRPVLVISGLIRDNPDLSAPLTIVRMLSTGGPVKESRVARDIGILSLLSSSLAVVTMLFAWRA
jgi:UDP-N-acetylglucosamine--dolichyl-phosphate N-acetylglucosaminephosphotransferase